MYVRQNNLNEMFMTNEEKLKRQKKKEEFRETLIKQIEQNKKRKQQERERLKIEEQKEEERIRKYLEAQKTGKKQRDSLDDFVRVHNRPVDPPPNVSSIREDPKPARSGPGPLNMVSIAEGKNGWVPNKLFQKENRVPVNSAQQFDFSARLSHLDKSGFSGD